MNDRPPSTSPGLNLDDIYHVLFRHKGKILFIWVLGAIVAAALWKTTPVFFKSDAKVLVRYIVESKTLNPDAAAASDSSIKNPDATGSGIINSEIEILTSYDLALNVAELVGPEKILAQNGGGSDQQRAAGIILSGLQVEPLRPGSVIRISFRNTDSAIVRPVLDQLIESYRRKHVATHLASGTVDEFLSQQADKTRGELQSVEEELRRAMTEVGVNSLEESKKEYSESISRIQKDIFDAQAELVGRLATVNQLTNAVEAAPVETNAPVVSNPIPQDVMDKYRRVAKQLETLEKQRENLEATYTPESVLVKGVKSKIIECEKEKALLETEFPDLARQEVIDTIARAKPSLSPTELLTEVSQIRALEARIRLQTERLEIIRKAAATLSAAEGKIIDLQRKRDALDQKYRYFSSRLERMQFAEAMSTGRVSNLETIQSPTPPYKDLGKLSKKLMMLLAGAFGAGLALAFGIEFYLDRSFKRPIEVENRLGLPLFLSIPRSNLNGKRRLLGGGSQRLLTNGENSSETAVVAPPMPPTDSAPWKPDHKLRPFFEALRDQLIMSFEMRNLTHNPKLVAVTSCRLGSGVSTIASGLAASLSETGEGNVLLVDMNNFGQGAAHYFRKGKLEVGLDEALEMEKRDSAMVQENLYVVAENASNQTLPRVLHKRFSSLLPRLKASDYDYIIFDMPPVSQISPTSKLARYMDMVFMVVEAEKTDRDAVQRATTLLEESKAHVGIVLNKTHNYVPKRLQHDV